MGRGRRLFPGLFLATWKDNWVEGDEGTRDDKLTYRDEQSFRVFPSWISFSAVKPYMYTWDANVKMSNAKYDFFLSPRSVTYMLEFFPDTWIRVYQKHFVVVPSHFAVLKKPSPSPRAAPCLWSCCSPDISRMPGKCANGVSPVHLHVFASRRGMLVSAV